MIPLLLSAALVAAEPASASLAPQGTVDFDLQCMILLQTASTQVPADAKPMIAAATMFYFGRVDSRLSSKELVAKGPELDAFLKKVDPQAGLKTCGLFMAERGKAMQEVGKAMDPTIK